MSEYLKRMWRKDSIFFGIVATNVQKGLFLSLNNYLSTMVKANRNVLAPLFLVLAVLGR